MLTPAETEAERSAGLREPDRLDLAVHAGILDLIPRIGATVAGVIIVLTIVADELRAPRRARIASADAADQQQPA